MLSVEYVPIKNLDRQYVPLPISAAILDVMEINGWISLVVAADWSEKQIDFDIRCARQGFVLYRVGDYIGSCVIEGQPLSFFTGAENSTNRPTNGSFHYLSSQIGHKE